VQRGKQSSCSLVTDEKVGREGTTMTEKKGRGKERERGSGHAAGEGRGEAGNMTKRRRK